MKRVITRERLTTVILPLDISAAFDTIDHSIILVPAHHDFGIHRTALMAPVILTDWKQYVAVGPYQSQSADCTSGVPHGSMRSPLLFACQTAITNMPQDWKIASKKT